MMLESLFFSINRLSTKEEVPRTVIIYLNILSVTLITGNAIRAISREQLLFWMCRVTILVLIEISLQYEKDDPGPSKSNGNVAVCKIIEESK